jgi:hypothetical protein
MKALKIGVVLLGIGMTTVADARNFALQGHNELCGGIGFGAGLSDWTPGGFKWFNDYSHQISQLAWFNVQFNAVLGGDRDHCWRDSRGALHCDPYYSYDYEYGFEGYALELGLGVKLKWRIRQIPLQIHAKFGGSIDALFFHNDRQGVGFGLLRAGAGVRYFFVPTFGLGAELITTFGPSYIEDFGAEFYAALDFNVGVEWRF